MLQTAYQGGPDVSILAGPLSKAFDKGPAKIETSGPNVLDSYILVNSVSKQFATFLHK